MLETKQDSRFDHPSKTFIGVHFVLLGFDSINRPKVLSKLVDGGGVDVGQYGPKCTHVIVDRLVYDDPICIAARSDGKTLVTSLWVGHSFDVGMPVDPTSIIYRPLRDLNGIPGAKSLIVCLTGYQRQDRDDIMTMVGLMGANFSKPLVANKVTHLICYKFEGEKYELAKKMKKIKLVNHRWLEDCLRAWEILPEAEYDKSGYELETLEAEAKDSEEEAECLATKQHEGRVVSPHQPLISKQEFSRNPLDSSASKDLSNVGNTNEMVSATGRETISDEAPILHNTHNKLPDVSGSRDTGTLRDVTCGEPSTPYDRTAVPARVGNDLASTSRSSQRSPHSDAANLGSLSYSRKTPRITTPSMNSGKMANNFDSTPTVKSHGFDISSFTIDQAKNGTDTYVKTPSKRTMFSSEEKRRGTLPEKRKMAVSCAISKSKKTSPNPKAHNSQGPFVANVTEGLEPASSIHDPVETNNCLPGNNAHYLNETASLNPAQNSPANFSTTMSSSFDRKSVTCGVPITKIVTSEIRQDDNGEEPLQASFMGLKKASLASKLNIRDVGTSRMEHATGEAQEPQNERQDIEVPSPGTKRLEIEKSNGSANLDLLKGGNAEEHSNSKPPRRKMLAKKYLGSKHSLGKGNTTNQKGSIYLNKTDSQNDAVTCSTGGKETAGRKKILNSEKFGMVSSVVNQDTVMGMKENDVPQSENEVENKSASMDDETEAPEDKEENEFEAAVNEEYGELRPDKITDTVREDKSECMHDITNKNDGSFLGMRGQTSRSGKDKNGAERKKEVCGNKTELGKSTDMENSGKKKITKVKKRPLHKTKKNTVTSVSKITNSKLADNEAAAKNDKSNEKTEMEKEESIPHAAGKTKRTIAENKSENPKEVEKDNSPIRIGDQTVSHGKKRVGKVASISNKVPRKIDAKGGELDLDPVQVEYVPKTETAWFILSGHKLQRKEFQQVIRRLKGRVCRDSHQWSYQATHFIVPDPIRRTEKFFAAAASGRWILKTDYLTASNQKGRFLAEEPYEWHKNSVSEDGAINLEAPRKWRLLRERTGHGAFYGMRIIIYGECIAPPLDTLKRVAKAGDGTILATSPPYTRFLESGIDFAIVSPGMPRVDMWVQEFLRHEIPCVVADYLVEYVCRPGYSLERHVLYNTHAWAEKSHKNLVYRLEEIVEDMKSPEDGGNNDIPCQVCGSRDRGEVMLICGDESGSTGCGVGTHIDCCDPPLEDVPEEDWFCPNCCKSRSCTNPQRSTKKGTSVSRRK